MPIFLAILILVSYAGYFSRLGAIGLTGPDEPRYASIARAMERTGDWVTPRLNGTPWFEKPVLYYWAAAVSFRVFGENDFAARLPSALAALLGAIAIAWAARRFYGESAAWLALLLVPSSVVTVVFGRAATPDMLFTGTLAAAMACGVALVFDEKPNIWHRIGFGFFLGAATLAKGPAAIVLAGGSVALWAVFSRQWIRALRVAHPLAVFVCLLTAGPWYALCARRNPDFLATFLLLHNFERFLTPVFHHIQPWWFFIPILVLWILPWTAVLFALVRDAASARQSGGWLSNPAVYFACWTIFTVVFFSISKSKLPGYIAPAVPPLLLLLAAAADRMRCRNDDSSRGVAMGLGVTWLALIGVAAGWLHRQPITSPASGLPHIWYWLAVTAAAGIVIAILGSTRRITAALLMNAMTIAALLVAANLLLLPRLDSNLSARAAAKAFLAINQSPDKSLPAALGAYRLDRAWQYGLEYYLDRPLLEWKPDAGGAFLLFTSQAGCGDIQNRGLICDPVQKNSKAVWLVRVTPSAASAR